MNIFNRNKISKQIVILIHCLLCLIIFSGCGLSTNLVQNNQSFHFILKYGQYAKNVLNTFEGTFTKDMVVDSIITIKFALSQEELDSIQNKMVEINIFEYPEKYQPWQDDGPPSNSVIDHTSYNTYYFKIQLGNQLKEIFWTDSNWSKATKAIRLRNLISQIVMMIESKKEFKKLPPPLGLYL